MVWGRIEQCWGQRGKIRIWFWMLPSSTKILGTEKQTKTNKLTKPKNSPLKPDLSKWMKSTFCINSGFLFLEEQEVQGWVVHCYSDSVTLSRTEILSVCLLQLLHLTGLCPPPCPLLPTEKLLRFQKSSLLSGKETGGRDIGPRWGKSWICPFLINKHFPEVTQVILVYTYVARNLLHGCP